MKDIFDDDASAFSSFLPFPAEYLGLESRIHGCSFRFSCSFDRNRKGLSG